MAVFFVHFLLTNYFCGFLPWEKEGSFYLVGQPNKKVRDRLQHISEEHREGCSGNARGAPLQLLVAPPRSLCREHAWATWANRRFRETRHSVSKMWSTWRELWKLLINILYHIIWYWRKSTYENYNAASESPQADLTMTLEFQNCLLK